MRCKSYYRKGIAGLVMLSAFAWMPQAVGKWANPDLLMTPEQVQKIADKPDWVIVDCRELDDYLKGHIPGAISLGGACADVLRDSTSRVLKPEKYNELFGKVGISNATRVVVYHGDMSDFTDATVAFWILEYMGHDKVHLLNGGLDAWRKAGLRLSDKPTRKEPTTFRSKVVASRIATTEEIGKIARGQAKGVQLVDSRTSREHRGDDIRSVRGGHVPNTTLNVSHRDTLTKVKDPKSDKMVEVAYLDPDTTAKAFEKLDKNARTIGYCQTGTRSTLTYLQYRLLGFKDPANWDDSWRVYGAKLDLPVNDEQWFDFAKVNSTVSKLEKRIKELEAAAAKAGGK